MQAVQETMPLFDSDSVDPKFSYAARSKARCDWWKSFANFSPSLDFEGRIVHAAYEINLSNEKVNWGIQYTRVSRWYFLYRFKSIFSLENETSLHHTTPKANWLQFPTNEIVSLELEFVTDRLNSSASLYRIAPWLSCLLNCKSIITWPWLCNIAEMFY